MARTRNYKKKTLAKKVAKIQKVMALYKPEQKYNWNYATTTFDNNPTGVIWLYQGVSQGLSDFANRIGDTIRVSKVRVKGYLTLPSTYQSTVVRIIAVIIKHNPDAYDTTAFSTIVNFYKESNRMNTNQAVNAFNDKDNASNFATLYDKVVTINTNSTAVGAGDVKKVHNFTVKIPKKYQEVQYVGGGSTTFSRNELMIFGITDTDSLVAYYNQFYTHYTDV